ncbi:MAG: ChbG/HpnK family deacetylase [Bradyrhizobium sp.]|nr:ChbG/HpnK family deacetylase [Bradyrhizobium sp.]
MNEAASRRIWLCADDYGISPGVNRSIRHLIVQGRLNATSVMVVGPAAGREEIGKLQQAVAERQARGNRCAVGLHVTLTAPFRPLTMHFRPADGGMFLPLPAMLRRGLARQLDAEIIRSEISIQLAAFAELFNRAPEFMDGHQHAQLFPVVRDAFLAAAAEHAPGAWVRQGGRHLPLARRLNAPKALLLDTLSRQFRKRAARANIAFNTAFAGAYDFSRQPDFGALMRQFLDGLPDGGLVMCHPGFVDETLESLDPLTHQREREHTYLAGDDFPALLAANRVTLE